MVGGDERMQVVFVASLERHSKSVNAIRFSPDGMLIIINRNKLLTTPICHTRVGKLLASAGDGECVGVA